MQLIIILTEGFFAPKCDLGGYIKIIYFPFVVVFNSILKLLFAHIIIIIIIMYLYSTSIQLPAQEDFYE